VSIARIHPVVLVAAGGALGTALRLTLDLLIPDAAELPLSTLLANLIGAFLLGALASRLPATSGMRLFAGTGLLGGFTTYSALTVGSLGLWQSYPWLAAIYALGSVVAGIALAALGLRAGRPRSVGAA